jgi:hypothetical protein
MSLIVKFLVVTIGSKLAAYVLADVLSFVLKKVLKVIL